MPAKRKSFIVVMLGDRNGWGFDETTFPPLIALMDSASPDYRRLRVPRGVTAYFLASPAGARRDFFQAHHVAQDAEMAKLLLDGYKRGLGFAIPLLGGTNPNSPHGMASQYQKDHQGEPIYNVAKGALEAAGCGKKDAADIVKAAKNYNEVRGWFVK